MKEQEENVKSLMEMTQSEFENYVDGGEYCDQDILDLWTELKKLYK